MENRLFFVSGRETFEKWYFLFEYKETENFNYPRTIFRTYGASRNIIEYCED